MSSHLNQVAHSDSVAFSLYRCENFPCLDTGYLTHTVYPRRSGQIGFVNGCLWSMEISFPTSFVPLECTPQRPSSPDSYSLDYAGHVQTVLYHSVSPQSPVCILKARVLKSQSVKAKPYDTWASIYKKDGRVIAADLHLYGRVSKF